MGPSSGAQLAGNISRQLSFRAHYPFRTATPYYSDRYALRLFLGIAPAPSEDVRADTRRRATPETADAALVPVHVVGAYLKHAKVDLSDLVVEN